MNSLKNPDAKFQVVDVVADAGNAVSLRKTAIFTCFHRVLVHLIVVVAIK